VKEMWNETFRVGSPRNQRVFHIRISTDDVSMSVYFHVVKARLKKEKVIKAKLEREEEGEEMLE